MELKQYKTIALIGIVIMGIGSFLACLSSSTAATLTGNILLLVSLGILTLAFSKWQP